MLSRKIGEARRAQQPADDFLADMRNASSERKQLDKQIKQIDHEILKYFQHQENPVETASQSTSRHYPHTDINVETIEISLFRRTDNPADWNNYVALNPAACIHHRLEWRQILKQCYGHDSLYLCARNQKHQIVGILPLIHIQSRLFGNMLVSMPFFQRAGAVADSPSIEAKLVQAAADYGKNMQVDHIEFRDDVPLEQLAPALPVQTHKVNMVLSLPSSPPLLWQQFNTKLRAQIRRSQREDTHIQFGKTELLDDFYAVYSRNMRDLGSPVQSRSFIESIMQQFPDSSWLVVVRLHGKPVSAGFLLGSDETLEIPLASTLREVNPLSINMLLYWNVLSFAIEQGFSRFDFGRSTKDAGTYRFKQQWGAKPKQLYWHYWLGRAREMPSLNPSNPKYALVINIWRRLPVRLTNILGPALVRYIP